MCNKINFVCNPTIKLCIDHDGGETETIDISVEELVKNDFWKLLEANILSTQEFPATVLSIFILKNKYFYSFKLRYWDGVGVRSVNNIYDVKTDERIESEREYIDL